MEGQTHQVTQQARQDLKQGQAWALLFCVVGGGNGTPQGIAAACTPSLTSWGALYGLPAFRPPLQTSANIHQPTEVLSKPFLPFLMDWQHGLGMICH